MSISLPLHVEICVGVELVNHERHEAAADTYSPTCKVTCSLARKKNSHTVAEDEVVRDADSPQKCSKIAEDSQVYSVEEEDVGKITSLGSTVQGDLDSSKPATPSSEDVVVQMHLPIFTAPVDPTPVESVEADATTVDAAPAPLALLPPMAVDVAAADVAAVDAAPKQAEPTKKSSRKTAKSPMKVHTTTRIPQNMLTKGGPGKMGRQGPTSHTRGRSKLVVFNVQGTLLDCSLLVEPNPNSKIRPTTKTPLKRVVFIPWLKPFLSRCFVHFVVAFWGSKSTSFMEDVVPSMMGGPLRGLNLKPLFEWLGKQCEFFHGGDGAGTSWGKNLSKVYATWP